MSDSASYFSEAGRVIATTDRQSWALLRIRCNIHILSSVHSKVYDLVSSTVDGVVGIQSQLAGLRSDASVALRVQDITR